MDILIQMKPNTIFRYMYMHSTCNFTTEGPQSNAELNVCTVTEKQ